MQEETQNNTQEEIKEHHEPRIIHGGVFKITPEFLSHLISERLGLEPGRLRVHGISDFQYAEHAYDVKVTEHLDKDSEEKPMFPVVEEGCRLPYVQLTTQVNYKEDGSKEIKLLSVINHGN